MAVAIYSITCIPTGRLYIGSSQRAQRRLWYHRWLLRRGEHSNRHLQRAWRKHGDDAFLFRIEEIVADVADLLAREQAWIDRHRAEDPKRLFNVCPVAGSRAGVPQPPSVGIKMRALHLGKPKTAEHRRAIGDGQRYRRTTPEQRAHLAEVAREQWADPARREKTMAAMRGVPRPREAYSDVARDAFSRGAQARALTPEGRSHLARMAAAAAAPDAIERMRASKLGKKVSPETRAKMSAAHRGKKRTGNFAKSAEWRAAHAAKLKGRARFDARTPAPEAVAEWRVAEADGASHSAIARAAGCSRATVTKFLRRAPD